MRKESAPSCFSGGLSPFYVQATLIRVECSTSSKHTLFSHTLPPGGATCVVDSNLVKKLSSIVEGVTNRQRATPECQGQAAPSDKDTSMLISMLGSLHAWMQVLSPIRTQLRSSESVRNETHALHAPTAPINSLVPMKTQRTNIQYRLEEVATDVCSIKARISGCSRHSAKIGRSPHDLDHALEGGILP